MTGFRRLAIAVGDVRGVWEQDPETDFQNYLKDMEEDKIVFLLALVGKGEIGGFSIVKLHKRLDPSEFDPTSCTIGIAVHPDQRWKKTSISEVVWRNL